MSTWRVRRERIVEQLRGLCSHRVALVIADAGFGKSVALRQFLDGAGDHVFFRVPPETVTLLGFLRGLTEALESVVPGAHLSLAMAYERAMQSTAPEAELTRWFSEHLREAAGWIVIDDLHNATDAAIGAFLASSIAAAPESVRWLIATRPPSTLPIASWLAHGAIDVPLDDDALRFSAAEVRELAERVGVPAPPEFVAQVMARSNGRASAAGLAIGLGAQLARVPPAATPLETYAALARATFDQHAAIGKAFLRKTAVFAELDPDLLRAAGWPGDAIVDELSGAGAYIDARGAGRFRYDGLFRAFLLDVLRDEGDEREALIEAAVACERLGRFGDALGFYRRAGAHAAGSRILAAHGIALMDEGSADLVEASIAALDEGEAAGPEIKTLRAILDSQRARFDSAEAWFQLAIHDAPDDDARLKMTYRVRARSLAPWPDRLYRAARALHRLGTARSRAHTAALGNSGDRLRDGRPVWRSADADPVGDRWIARNVARCDARPRVSPDVIRRAALCRHGGSTHVRRTGARDRGPPRIVRPRRAGAQHPV